MPMTPLGGHQGLPIFQVDAFTDRVFGGNPAAVCPLEHWLPDAVMQQIAAENAVAETAFFVQRGLDYEIRWFTPEIEMDLCGHATLAAAHVIARYLEPTVQLIRFHSRSGELFGSIDAEWITLDFPSRRPEPAQGPAVILDALGIAPVEVLKARDYIVVLASEDEVRRLAPDRNLLDRINLDPGGVAVTAQGDEVDFVSRYFTPQASIFEDPVTGSAHCSLVPYWAQKLGKETMIAKQLSPRLGTLHCRYVQDRVQLSGRAVTYLEGRLTIPSPG